MRTFLWSIVASAVLLAQASQAQTEDGRCITHFYSKQPGLVIVVGGEFVGKTSQFPLRVDMTDHAKGTVYTDGRFKLESCSFRESLIVKAMPAGTGCVNAELMRAGQKIPKKMYFDSDLCPATPAIDLNLN